VVALARGRAEALAHGEKKWCAGKVPGGWCARASRRGNIWARDSAI
jgi:hypothetical protein